MILRPASFLSRILALALLGAVLAGLYLLAVRPMTEQYLHYRRSIDQSQDLLGQYRRLGASLPALQSQLDELDRRRASAGTQLQGASDALVAADLQNRIKGIVDARGGQLTSTQILAAKDEAELRRIGIRVQMTATVDALYRIFYDLESGKPFLFLDNIDIRQRRARRRRKEAADDSNLAVRFDIYGYLRTEAT